MMTTDGRGRGFTLIELLVVISIIAVLAAILMPVVRSTREKARQARCMTNLMTINQALRAYQADYTRYPFTPFYDDVANAYEGGVSALYPDYITDKSVLICPNDKGMAGKPGLPARYSSYNGLLHGSVTSGAAAPDCWRFEAQAGGPGAATALCCITYNYGGFDANGWDMSYWDTATSRWVTALNPVGGAPPTWLTAEGKRWRAYPRLLNQRAPDNTVTVHCLAHRSFYGEEETAWRDPIVRLSGTAETVNYSQWKTPANAERWMTQK